MKQERITQLNHHWWWSGGRRRWGAPSLWSRGEPGWGGGWRQEPLETACSLPFFFFFFGLTAGHTGSYFPDQGLNPCPLQWKRSLNHWTTREVPLPFFFLFCTCSLLLKPEVLALAASNHLRSSKNADVGGFPGGAVVESLPANAGDTGSSPGLGRSHMPRSN